MNPTVHHIYLHRFPRQGTPTFRTRGKPILPDVWATWCGPCIREIPTLRAIHEDTKNENLVILSISIDAELEAAKAYATANNVTWMQGALLWDIVRKFEITGIPSVCSSAQTAKSKRVIYAVKGRAQPSGCFSKSNMDRLAALHRPASDLIAHRLNLRSPHRERQKPINPFHVILN